MYYVIYGRSSTDRSPIVVFFLLLFPCSFFGLLTCSFGGSVYRAVM